MARTINMNGAYEVVGHCVTCGEEIIAATMRSSETCPRCGMCPVDLTEDQKPGLCSDCGHREATVVLQAGLPPALCGPCTTRALGTESI